MDDQLSACFTAGLQSESTKRYLYSLPESSVEKFDGLSEFALIYENSGAEALRSENFHDVAFVGNSDFRGRGTNIRGRFKGKGRGRSRGGFTASRTEYLTSGRGDYAFFGCGAANYI